MDKSSTVQCRSPTSGSRTTALAKMSTLGPPRRSCRLTCTFANCGPRCSRTQRVARTCPYRRSDEGRLPQRTSAPPRYFTPQAKQIAKRVSFRRSQPQEAMSVRRNGPSAGAIAVCVVEGVVRRVITEPKRLGERPPIS